MTNLRDIAYAAFADTDTIPYGTSGTSPLSHADKRDIDVCARHIPHLHASHFPYPRLIIYPYINLVCGIQKGSAQINKK